MAAYKYAQHFVANQDPEFDRSHLPGSIVPYSGIYRCTNCGDEVACNKHTRFPPQNHRQHRTRLPIRWRLVAAAIQRP